MSDDMIRALLIERAGYERMGKTDRAAAVTAELRRLGHPDATPDISRDDVKPSRGTRTTKA